MAYCLLPNRETHVQQSVHATHWCCSSDGYLFWSTSNCEWFRVGHRASFYNEFSKLIPSWLLLPLHASSKYDVANPWVVSSIIIIGPSSGVSHRKPQPQWGFEGIHTMMASVAFCPLTYVRTAWLAIQQGAPDVPRVDEPIDYFTATWINGNFSPIHWNYFNSPEPTTTLRGGIPGWRKSSASPTQTSLHGSTTSKEEAVTKAKIQNFRFGATAWPWRRRMKEKRFSLTASTREGMTLN